MVRRRARISLLLLLSAFHTIGACARPLAKDPLAAGIAAAREDRWEEAVQYWKQALEHGPDSAAIHNNLAVAYEKLGAFKDAGHEYEAALGLDPSNSEIKENYESFKLRLEAARRMRP